MADAVGEYAAGISAENRALFDRFHALVLAAFPQAQVVTSYKMPTYVVGERRLHVGAWKHGLSLYGWSRDRDAGFSARHPELDNGKGTLRLPRDVAAGLDDDELRDLITAVLTA